MEESLTVAIVVASLSVVCSFAVELVKTWKDTKAILADNAHIKEILQGEHNGLKEKQKEILGEILGQGEKSNNGISELNKYIIEQKGMQKSAKEHGVDIFLVQSQILALSRTLDELRGDINARDTKIQALERNILLQEQTINGLESKCKEYQTKVDGLQEEISKKDRQILLLENQMREEQNDSIDVENRDWDEWEL